MYARQTRSIVLCATLLLLALAGAASAGDIQSMQAWSRATPPGMTVGVGYVMLHNTGKKPRVLVSASSPVAAAVEMHETQLGNNGLSQMRPVKKLTVPAGGAVTFEPGGKHLMLVGLKEPFVAGQRVPVMLRFDDDEAVTVELDVQPLTGGAPPAEHRH